MYVYVSMYVCMYAGMYISVYVCVCMYVCMHACMHVCVSVHILIHHDNSEFKGPSVFSTTDLSIGQLRLCLTARLLRMFNVRLLLFAVLPTSRGIL